MKKRPVPLRGVSFAACFALLSITRIAGAEQIKLPDTATGVIRGRVALMLWPAKNTVDGQIDTLLPVDDCRAILSPWSDFSAERSFPCGVWFQPADGRYQVWLENGSDRISSIAGTIQYGAEPCTG